MCPSTNEGSQSLWRPFLMNTSSSLVLHSPAPTRSLWMREKCSLKPRRYTCLSSLFSLAGASFPRVIKHCGKNKRATVPYKEESVPLNLNITFLVQLLKKITFICILAGWRDHQDHESLHKHDREEALQCEVCIQLWNQLDQVIPLGRTTARTQPLTPGKGKATEILT